MLTEAQNRLQSSLAYIEFPFLRCPHLCCRMGMGTDLVAVGALLVSYYTARNVVIQ